MKAVLIAAMALVALSTGAQAQQKYPPYPDVWGRELKPGEGRPWLRAQPQDSGDVGLVYGTQPEDVKGSFPDRLVTFFLGQIKDLGANDAWNIGNEWNYIDRFQREDPFESTAFNSRGVYALDRNDFHIYRSGYEFKIFQDDNAIIGRQVVPRTRWMCVFGDFIHTLRERGELIGEKVIVRLRPETVSAEVGGTVVTADGMGRLYSDSCQESLPYTRYQSRIAFWRLMSHPRLFLDDGTFLAVVHTSQRMDAGMDEWDRRIVVRMRPDLTSPYLEGRSDVHIVDFARIEPILKESERRVASDPSFNDAEFIAASVADLIDTLPPKRR